MFRILLITLLIFPSAQAAQHRWDIDILADTFGVDSSTPSDYPWGEVIQACPRRDCIPSIDKPTFVSATQASFLKDDDIVIAVAMEGEARAYPIRILVRHELVNDTIGRKPILVSYCPLCVSGLLHNSDLVMYDRKTASLWQQITGGVTITDTKSKQSWVAHR